MKLFTIIFFLHSTLSWATLTENQLTIKQNNFSYFSNFSLTDSNDKIEEAIIVVHGSDRNADTYYSSISRMAEATGHTESTLVVSPHFKLASDVLVNNELTFTDEGWLKGDESLNNYQIRSFDIIDHLVELIMTDNHFKNLKRIVITGHSAGGQLTQRYSLGSLLDQLYPSIHFRYIVLNPGSYAYLNLNRPIDPSGHNCAYNDYKYGLDHLNSYMSQTPLTTMINNYLNKDVIYFLGEKDIDTEEVDNECPAQLQGLNRLQRGLNFKANIDQNYPSNLHHLVTNPGVAHTEWGMYSSELGKNLLFNF